MKNQLKKATEDVAHVWRKNHLTNSIRMARIKMVTLVTEEIAKSATESHASLKELGGKQMSYSTQVLIGFSAIVLMPFLGLALGAIIDKLNNK